MFRRLLRVLVPATAALTLLAGTEAGATPDPGPTTVVDNVFLPEDANIGDCVSALPRPECGSEARGGWRQGLILIALLGGLGVIAWRVVVGMRRPRDAPTPERKPERTP